MSSKRGIPGKSYNEPGKGSRSRPFRYRYPNLDEPRWGSSWSDWSFYKPENIRALDELGVPLPGEEPMLASA